MATKKVYDACCKQLQSMTFCSLSNKGGSKRLLKPNLHKLFGKKAIVNDRQMLGCSKAEKRRHLYEDKVLRLLYLENQSYVGFGVVK